MVGYNIDRISEAGKRRSVHLSNLGKRVEVTKRLIASGTDPELITKWQQRLENQLKQQLQLGRVPGSRPAANPRRSQQKLTMGHHSCWFSS